MKLLPDWLTGLDREAYEKGLAADAENQALNAKKHDEGKMSDADFSASQENFARSIEDPDAAITAAAKEGFQDGIDNVRGTLGDILALPFKLIPPIGWLLIAAALFVYMGGFARLGGSIKRGKF